MQISEEQLKTWSHGGAIQTAKKTHESIRHAIDQYLLWDNYIKPVVYLQGSYKNSTNIRGDSDVDIIVCLESEYSSDISRLSDEQKRKFRIHYFHEQGVFQDFKNDVFCALSMYYDDYDVEEGNKAIRIETPYLKADVIACIQHRLYTFYGGPYNENFAEGITFVDSKSRNWIINYPKLHHDNGTRKNKATNKWFKATVRVFKNARYYLVKQNSISPHLAPSYFIECLLCNVPDAIFGRNYMKNFYNVLEWISDADLSTFVCQNGIQKLFGDSSTHWSTKDALDFISILSQL